MPAVIEKTEASIRECVAQPVGVALDRKDRVGGTPEHVDRDAELRKSLVEVMPLLVLDP